MGEERATRGTPSLPGRTPGRAIRQASDAGRARPADGAEGFPGALSRDGIARAAAPDDDADRREQRRATGLSDRREKRRLGRRRGDGGRRRPHRTRQVGGTGGGRPDIDRHRALRRAHPGPRHCRRRRPRRRVLRRSGNPPRASEVAAVPALHQPRSGQRRPLPREQAGERRFFGRPRALARSPLRTGGHRPRQLAPLRRTGTTGRQPDRRARARQSGGAARHGSRRSPRQRAAPPDDLHSDDPREHRRRHRRLRRKRPADLVQPGNARDARRRPGRPAAGSLGRVLRPVSRRRTNAHGDNGHPALPRFARRTTAQCRDGHRSPARRSARRAGVGATDDRRQWRPDRRCRVDARRERAEACPGTVAAGQGRGRERQPCEERFPGQHEPRTAHPAQRRPGLLRTAAARCPGRPRTALGRTNGASGDDSPQRRTPAHADQQRPRAVAYRSRPQRDHPGELRPPRPARRPAGDVRPQGHAPGAALRGRAFAGHTTLRRHRRGQAAPGADQPDRQRLQVHRTRRHPRGRRRHAAGRQGHGAPPVLRGVRHRRRHRRG
ncbi:MAG: hypothetical protein CAPSK01_000532 [Candidatus Accumulibacter vicinus]|uniref:Uncharacterized protein n=1 Tax=Candidatus Accumulibacter vicinus TaxID=2954382 RepID=A0A084Y525_9PROT|nr:MAG: hypothetical protein CAPSK01_000532 [Candidatus Accumulibacter vicinus]